MGLQISEVFEHRCPILQADNGQPPKCTDRRIVPFLKQLVEHGVMNDGGISKVHGNLKRGIEDGHWIYRFEVYKA